MNFKNKTILITGACSGIGKIMARKSLERGAAQIVIVDINKKGLTKTHEDIKPTVDVNTSAFIHLTLELLPQMMKRNTGAICNITASAGLISNPKMSAYGASKWATTGWSDSLRIELKQLNKNISVTTVMPFFIKTGMFKGVKSKLLPISEPENATENAIKAIEKEKKLKAFPMLYWFIRLSQGILPQSVFEWVMEYVFGIYSTMDVFTGRSR